jgi:hypothetical protein
MQGAAGIGAWLLELDGFDRKRPRVVTFRIRRTDRAED